MTLKESAIGLPLGTVVEPWGEVAGKMITCGEPYYFLHKKGGLVSLLPAKMVLRHYEMNKKEAK